MRVNVDKVLERDQKLSELDDRADALQAGASQFESSAAKLKNKYWWKNCKVGALGRCRRWLFVPCSWKIKTLLHRKRTVCREAHCYSQVRCSEYVYVVRKYTVGQLRADAKRTRSGMQAEKSHSGLLLEIRDPAVMHDVTPPTHSALQSTLPHLKMFVRILQYNSTHQNLFSNICFLLTSL